MSKKIIRLSPSVQGRRSPSITNAGKTALHSLTAAALVLPGLLQPGIAQAADEDSVDFQYSHYQEGKRQSISSMLPDGNTYIYNKYPVPNKRNPIEVDSLHGSARVSLTDRIKFAFNYVEDTWSGATPLGSAPEGSYANGRGARGLQWKDDGTPIPAGASPYATAGTYLDKQGHIFYPETNPITGQISYKNDKVVHVLSYASPETRKQGDFNLSYQWDEAALDVGGGISIERDYESRFVNLGGRMDFNQKCTTVDLGLSYTNSAINSYLDPAGASTGYFIYGEQHDSVIHHNQATGLHNVRATREDWATHLNLTQVINRDALLQLGMGFTRNTGFLENPYKLSWLFGVIKDQQTVGLPQDIFYARGKPFVEQRPDARNQWNWSARWVQYVEPLNAALHLDYQFAHDNWGINAHTFAADWVQPLGAGWAVTPRIRYYSQSAADFYQPFFIVEATSYPSAGDGSGFKLPQNFSSDQRLSGYGTLSGGVTVGKQFAKGIGMEAGFEYYTHQGGLKLGGGEADFANFDYWVANAALKVNLSALSQGSSGIETGGHDGHHGHANIPAGVMFAHALDKAGDMMAGYRYMRNMLAGDFLHGDHNVSQQQTLAVGCPGSPRDPETPSSYFDGNCSMLPTHMNMNMHMLELMYAPTDWLSLMLMPQFVDMDMVSFHPQTDDGHVHTHLPKHEIGGIGDTGLYALVNLFDRPNQHVHIGFGISAPTGDVGIKNKDRPKDLDGAYAHYGMQLGSGTWDFKPSLTYLGKAGDWNWGAQLAGTKRLESSNKSGYALGDIFETSVWGGYDITNWLSASVRMAYTWQGAIKGRYPRSTRLDSQLSSCNQADYTYPDTYDEYGNPAGPSVFHPAGYNTCLAALEDQKRMYDAQDRPSPMDFPHNYGGHYVDIGFGLSATVPTGAFADNRLAFEWLQPVYTNVNGYQLNRDGALTFTWSYGF